MSAWVFACLLVYAVQVDVIEVCNKYLVITLTSLPLRCFHSLYCLENLYFSALRSLSAAFIDALDPSILFPLKEVFWELRINSSPAFLPLLPKHSHCQLSSTAHIRTTPEGSPETRILTQNIQLRPYNLIRLALRFPLHRRHP